MSLYSHPDTDNAIRHTGSWNDFIESKDGK